MEKMQKKLGFGFMRLPMKDGQADIPQTCDMVDLFLRRGFNYSSTPFDTRRTASTSRPESVSSKIARFGFSIIN